MPRISPESARGSRALGRSLSGLVLCGLGALAGCGAQVEPAQAEPAQTARPLNLILISIDTLRADRLSCYGYERETTPHLDALAAESQLFEQTVAPSSWTLPSHFTLLSGLMPTSHGVTDPERKPGLDLPRLSHWLAAAGRHPFAITDGGWMAASSGFGTGFREYEDEERGLDAVLGRALEYIEHFAGEAPYFAFLHTYDTHCPYEPPEPWRGSFETAGAAALPVEGRCGNPHFNERGVSPEEARFLSDRYDEEIRAADEALGAFLEELRASGELERSVLVVTSDHGEEFLEHGKIGHEGTLHVETLKVPLLIRVPGLAGRRIAASASLADVAPTCLSALGIEVPADLDGRDLLSPAPATSEFVYSELDWNGRLRSWLGPELHLIEDLETGERRLYDLSEDPLETRDLSAERPQVVESLSSDWRAYARGLEPRDAILRDSPLSADQRRRLIELGYADLPPDER